MATIKAYMTPLRRATLNDEERRVISYTNPSAAASLLNARTLNGGGSGLMYSPPTSGASGILGGRVTLSDGAAGLAGRQIASYLNPNDTSRYRLGGGSVAGAASGGSGTSSGGTQQTGVSEAKPVESLPNNSYQYADMYGDENTLLAYKALPEYLSAQGLRNQGMSETAWLAIRNAYEPPVQASSGSTAVSSGSLSDNVKSILRSRGGGSSGGFDGTPTDLDAIYAGLGIPNPYAEPAAAPSGSGTTKNTMGWTQTQLDQAAALKPYNSQTPNVVYRNGEAYYQDGTAQGGTYSDVTDPLTRAKMFSSVPEAAYLDAYKKAAATGKTGDELNAQIAVNLYRKGYVV